MAVQVHLALSSTVSGMAAIAGGTYWCTEGRPLRAQTCMVNPYSLRLDRYVRHALSEARAGRIDPLENLRDDNVFVFASLHDEIVSRGSSERLKQFYKAFMPESRIRYRGDFNSKHGFITRDFGVGCHTGGPPYMLKCDHDLAGEILGHLYGMQKEPVRPRTESLRAFAQGEFGADRAMMHKLGFVYIPQECASGAACGLHIALHGCMMNPDYIGSNFAVHSGFNAWAEANRLVILYPSSAKSFLNPLGCWDWVGWTGGDYAARGGAQISVIKAMIDRLTN